MAITGPGGVDPNEVGVGELGRLVQSVLLRFESLATKLESQFVRIENYDLYKQIIANEIAGIKEKLTDMASKSATVERLGNDETLIGGKASKGELEALTKRVSDLEDDKKWLTRIILSFVILGVLSAVFVAAKVGGGS